MTVAELLEILAAADPAAQVVIAAESVDGETPDQVRVVGNTVIFDIFRK